MVVYFRQSLSFEPGSEADQKKPLGEVALQFLLFIEN